MSKNVPGLRPIYLVFALSFVNETGLRVANVVLLLFAVKLGADPFTAGLVAATFSIFPILVAVQVGRLADRFGSRWLLVYGAIISTLGMLVPYFSPGLPALFIAATLYGVFDGIHLVSLQNLVGLLSTPDNRARNFTNLSLVNSISVAVGPLLAGLVIDYSGHGQACLMGAILAAVPIVLLVFWGGGLPSGSREAKNGGTTLGMLWEPAVRFVLITGILYQSGNTLYQAFMPVYSSAAGLSATAVGIVLSMNSVAMFMVRLILPAMIIRFTDQTILIGMFYLSAASLILIPFFNDPLSLAVLSFLFGLGTGCAPPLIQLLMFNAAPPGRSGEAMGLRMSVNHVTKMLTPIAFGAIASGFGFPAMFVACALLMSMGGIFSRKK